MAIVRTPVEPALEVSHGIYELEASQSGTFDLTIPGFKSTPKAIMLYGTVSSATDASAYYNRETFAIADDAGKLFAVAVTSDHGTPAGNTYCKNYQWDETHSDKFSILAPANPLASPIWAATVVADGANGPIAGGWRVTITNTTTSTYKLFFTLFGGADLSAAVTTFSPGDTSIDAGVGIPTAVLAFSGNQASGTGSETKCEWSRGFSDGTTQLSVSGHTLDAANPTDNQAWQSTTAAVAGIGTDPAWTASLANFTVNGFDSTVLEGTVPAGVEVGALVLSCPSKTIEVRSLPLVTNAGNIDWEVTGYGYRPQHMMCLYAWAGTFDEAVTEYVWTSNLVQLNKDGRSSSYASWQGDGRGSNTTGICRWSLHNFWNESGAIIGSFNVTHNPFTADGFYVIDSQHGSASALGSARPFSAIFFEE